MLNFDVVRNIEIMCNSASPSLRFEGLSFWSKISDKTYREARIYHIPDKTFCGMVAILSPGLNLHKAIEYAITISAELKRSTPIEELSLLGAYGWDNIRKAAEFFQRPVADNIKGNKVINTYQLLVKPNDTSIALGKNEKRAAFNDFSSDDTKMKISPKQYVMLSEHYYYVAEKLSIKPCELQAVVNLQVSEYISRHNAGVFV